MKMLDPIKLLKHYNNYLIIATYTKNTIYILILNG